MNTEPIGELVDTGLLREVHVEDYFDESAFSAIVLTFDDVTLVLRVDGRTDSISRSIGKYSGLDLRRETPIAPWSELVGARMIEYWEMYNRAGYRDAVQMQFLKNDQSETILQLLAIGCRFEVYAVSQLNS